MEYLGELTPYELKYYKQWVHKDAIEKVEINYPDIFKHKKIRNYFRFVNVNYEDISIDDRTKYKLKEGENLMRVYFDDNCSLSHEIRDIVLEIIGNPNNDPFLPQT